ncbi:MAG TPA: phospholipid carrier-dependent glycosyltransferase [Candidatus Tumulicola sp.]
MRNRYDPRQGLTALRAPIDYALMAAFGIGNFALSLAGYWWPNGSSCWTLGRISRCGIFDELYFARAGEEYLQNLRIYENTHPPLSKLLVTLSMMLFGGMPRGDNPYGWRFLDVVFGALAVMLLFAFAKRVTGSTAFASIAALLLSLDGEHFVQSRIATPEGFVVFFATLVTYAFYRFWLASQAEERCHAEPPPWVFAAGAAGSLAAGAGLALAGRAMWGFDPVATAVAAAYVTCGAYLVTRYAIFPRVFGAGTTLRTADGNTSKLWLAIFSVALGCLVSTKWYGVMGFGVSFCVLIGIASQAVLCERQPAPWGNPRGCRLDGTLTAILFVSATVYGLVWLPDVLRHAPDPNEVHGFNDVVHRQYSMFEYHAVELRNATHPYSSKWWEWPLDLVPVAYYYRDSRTDGADPKGCCIYEITSMANPAILWFGLACVPWVGVLGWRERNKGYALIVLTYLLQWLPWMGSPRITFAYHFYVDVPLICLCNAIVLQRFWQWGKAHRHTGNAAMAAIVAGAYVAIAAGAFAFFLPILAAHPLSWNAWHARMWLPTWIIGPG